MFIIVLKGLELSGNSVIKDASVKDRSLEDVQRSSSTQAAVSNASALEQGLRTYLYRTGVADSYNRNGLHRIELCMD